MGIKLNLLLIMAAATVINFPPSLVNERYRFLFTEPCRSVPTQIIYGGASSGKSVSIAQRDVIDIINEPRNFLIVRNTANTLRSSVFEERAKIIRQYKLSPLFDVRESDLTITYRPRGTKMLFRGLDDVEKLKSITVPVGTLTDLRMEEATEAREEDYDELCRRMRGPTPVPKREVILLNPVLRSHWICRRWFKGANVGYHRDADLLILRTTYRDNKFLTDQDRKKIEALTGYQRDVYCDGKWGVLGDLIFTNWEVQDLRGRSFDNVRQGLDFGFSVDPSAYIQAVVHEPTKTIYVLKELYIRGATNDVLAKQIKPHEISGGIIWCDSAEPKSIMELRNQGENSLTAHPVTKGRDSVWHSIQWLQQYRIVVDKTCTNTIDELSSYQWEKNKHGETLCQPVGTNDHCIAALRYATERDRAAKPAIV